MKIGIAGTGKMGAAIAGRLAALGHQVAAWNRTPERSRPLAAAGMQVAASPEDLAASAETVISMLTDGAAVESVYSRLLSGDVGGKLFVEMSTVRPAVQEALASRVREKGAAFVECPVGGSTGPAKEGKLFGFAGGDVADVARAKPLLDQLCRRVEHVGLAGAGATMKLAVNLPLMVYWQSLGEALSLARSLNLEPARLMDILGDTSGAPAMLKIRGPMIAAALAGNDGPVTVNIDTLRKDLSEIVAEIRSRGRTAPVSEAALQTLSRAIEAGLGARDCVMMPVSWSSEPKQL